VDEVIAEPAGGAHREPKTAIESLGSALARHLDDLAIHDRKALKDDRYDRFRRLGAVLDEATP
jgi:acetyl-CoA carboxylase carboxyl transferase subunit alpha